jgi:hypothetical protein
VNPSSKSQLNDIAPEEVFRKFIGDGVHEGNVFAVKEAIGFGNTMMVFTIESLQPKVVSATSLIRIVSFVDELLIYVTLGDIALLNTVSSFLHTYLDGFAPTEILFKEIVKGEHPLLTLGVKSALGGNCTLSCCIDVSGHPFAEFTINRTLYKPGVLKVCVGFVSVEVLFPPDPESSKFHTLPEIALPGNAELASVNCAA